MTEPRDAEDQHDDQPLDALALRQEIEGARRKKVEDTARLFLNHDGDAAHIAANLTWIESSAKLLAALDKPPSRTWVAPVVIAAVCILLAGLLWTQRIGSVNVMLRLETEAVSFHLAERWDADQDLTTRRVRVEGLSRIGVAALDDLRYERAERDVRVEVRDSALIVANLEITPLDPPEAPGAGTLELSVQGDELELSSRGGQLRGDIIVRHPARLTFGTRSADSVSALLDVTYPETITLYSNGQGAVPTRFRIQHEEPLRLEGLKVQQIYFREDDPSVSGQFRSAIGDGTLTLLDIPSKSVALHRRDWVLLIGPIKAERLEITVAEQISIMFMGKVGGLRVGPEGFERNLAPSWLEYWYHNSRIALFLSVVGSLWAFLWSVRKLLFVRES